MTPLSERMVEAAARAILAQRFLDIPWERLPPLVRSITLVEARAALTAALAVAEFIPADAVPDERETDTPVDGYNAGWNACRATTLAGRVTL
jgi:hypothetical protein